MNRPTQTGEIERELDAWHMRRALDLAALGRGAVEPNPLVGCVLARGAEIIGEGYHRRYGGPHAEIEALALAGDRAAGTTAYVTLEPCCHFGKTPPCTQALIAAGVKRVVAAMADPFPQVAGKGTDELRTAGIEVEIGLHEAAARSLNAPYLKLLATGRPWIIAKWAMTLDGKLATSAGDSVWISNEASRNVVHEIRGRMDAIVIAAGTARTDDPLITARPPGSRTPLRVVVDDRASLRLESRLIRTIAEAPVLIATAAEAPAEKVAALRNAGCEVLLLESPDRGGRLLQLLEELGRRRLTNVLVEGGPTLFGTLFDGRHVDEIHAFIAPKIAGGRDAPSPVGGRGFEPMAVALKLDQPQWRVLEGDGYLQGRVSRTDSPGL